MVKSRMHCFCFVRNSSCFEVHELKSFNRSRWVWVATFCQQILNDLAIILFDVFDCMARDAVKCLPLNALHSKCILLQKMNNRTTISTVMFLDSLPFVLKLHIFRLLMLFSATVLTFLPAILYVLNPITCLFEMAYKQTPSK